ncbi:cilia- and flagella-associated protein 73 isoform X3 [Numida meleagris]|uniref:cilia- and flagella-associated protein 73 isoform X3 n=1 Tax=Numida meleagris TaxID=8996 RepID=UPI000B3DBC07|nr:cilia- and flagella-associated protein 73 isoform X3 [Numida meleagris]
MAAPRPAPPLPLRAAQAPDAAPEMSVGLEENLSRAFQDKLRLQTVPPWDSVSLLPSRRLLLKRREVVEVERALQAQREDFQRRMERVAQRRRQLGQREEQLRDDTIKFNAFLKAMSARQQRAQQRAGEERARAAQRGAEALRLQQELGGLQRHREQLGRRLRSLRVFGDFLQDARAATGQDIPAMLAHFGVLAEARAVLLRQAEAGREALAQGRAQLQQCCEEADSELTSGNEEVLQLRARLEAARRDVLEGSHPVSSCCAACRTWLPCALSCAPRSWGCVLMCLPPPPPHTHHITGLSPCLPARNRWTLGDREAWTSLPNKSSEG